MSSRLALIALLTLPLAACEGTGLPGMGGQEEPQVEGHKGPPGVSPIDAPIETGAEGAAISTVNAETYNTAAFSARGNEPFWSVDASGSTAIYKTPENQKGRAVRVNRLAFAEGVEYVGVLNGRPFVLTVRGNDCRDDMSGQKFPMTASLTVSGRTNNGCAAPAAAEVAQAVAAIKAPAPAAPKPAAVAQPKPAAPKPAPASAPATLATPPADASAPATPPTPPANEGTSTLPAAPEATTPAAETPAPEAPSTETPAAEAPASTAPATGTGTGTGVPAPALTLPATPPALPDSADSDGDGDAETTE